METRDYAQLITDRQRKYPDKFSAEALNPDFIPYYSSGQRVEVDFGYAKKRGTIGITIGWKPVFLLMLTKRSQGSSYTIGMKDKVLRVIR
jgi:hypothetical protein